ncbi:MAG: hypothetical protein ABIP78_00880 [Pyrinomonadaceae bacterium]
MKKLIPIIVFFFSVSVFAQNVREAVLIDEIGKTGCEDLLARTDNFINHLQSQPELTGIVIVFGFGDSPTQYPANFIHRTIIGRSGIKLKVKIFRDESQEPWRVQFWTALDESEVAGPTSQLVSSIPFEITERFYFGAASGDPCTNYFSNGFADVLKSNPQYTAQIVNFNIPKKERQSTISYWLEHFRKEHAVTNQIRIYFKNEKPKKYDLDKTEFWILPRKQK